MSHSPERPTNIPIPEQEIPFAAFSEYEQLWADLINTEVDWRQQLSHFQARLQENEGIANMTRRDEMYLSRKNKIENERIAASNTHDEKIRQIRAKLKGLHLNPYEVIQVANTASPRQIYEAQQTQLQIAEEKRLTAARELGRISDFIGNNTMAGRDYVWIEYETAQREQEYADDLQQRIRAAYQQITAEHPYDPSKKGCLSFFIPTKR